MFLSMLEYISLCRVCLHYKMERLYISDVTNVMIFSLHLYSNNQEVVINIIIIVGEEEGEGEGEEEEEEEEDIFELHIFSNIK